jgi:hypothetical protein
MRKQKDLESPQPGMKMRGSDKITPYFELKSP